MSGRLVRVGILLTLCLTFGDAAYAQKKMCNLTAGEENFAFKDGEELTYVANYTWGLISTDVGEATVTVSRIEEDENPYYFIEATAKTYKFYDSFFKVRDVYMARFHAKTMRPAYFHRNINEGGYVKRNTYNFDWNAMKIKSITQRKNDLPVDHLLPLTDCTFDVLTMLYYSRNLDYGFIKEGESFPLTFAIDEEVYNIKYRFVKRESIAVKGFGNIRCMRFAVEVIAGEVFTGKDEIIMWVTDDKNRLPIKIESPIKVGTVKAILIKAKNTRVPISSEN